MNGPNRTPLPPELAPPAPPRALRERALAAARESWGSGAEPARVPDRWTRAWESRPLRLAWAAAVVALLAGHLLLPRAASTKPPAAARAAAVPPAAVEAQRPARVSFAESLSLPPIDLSTRPWIGRAEQRRLDPDPDPRPVLRKEPA